MPISLRCSRCSRVIHAPDQAAGKRVKCPSCGTLLAVPAAAPAAAATPAGQPAAARTGQPAAARTPKPAAAAGRRTAAASGFDFPEDLLTASDFDTRAMGSAGLYGRAAQPAGSSRRSDSYYRLAGGLGIAAATLNLLFFLGVLTWAIIGLVAWIREENVAGADLAMPIGMLCLWGFFNLFGSIHAISGRGKLRRRSGRKAAGTAVTELLLAPLILGVFFWGWNGVIVGGIAALYSWPIALWMAIAISGRQAKADLSGDDQENWDQMAEQLQRRIGQSGGH